MKNILLLIHDDAGQEARLRAALDLTHSFKGHLICVDVTMMPTIGLDDYAGTGGAMLLAAERERETDNKTRLEGQLAQERVSWEWIDVTDSLAGGVLNSASLADIIVLSSGLESYPAMRDVASEILMHTRTPILTVPEALDHLTLRRALIAWDGRASCATVMHTCTRLLAQADEVEIFTVAGGSGQVSAQEAARYLARHRILASVRIVERDHRDVAHLIEDESARWKADYILMGAYGRGRFMETFGGVTKHMLGHARLPLVLAH